MRLLLTRFLVAALAIAGYIAVKLALDVAIAPYPWFIVTFVAVLLATLVGGAVSGVIANGGLLVAVLAGAPGRPSGDPDLIAIAPAVHFVSGLFAILTGEAVRITQQRAERSLRRATVASRTSADLDRRWSVVVGAIGDLGQLKSPLQVEDAVRRHAAALIDRAVRFVPGSAPVPVDEEALAVPVVGERGPYGTLMADADHHAGRDPAGARAAARDDAAGLLALAMLAGAALDRIHLQSASGTSVASAARTGERLQRLHALTSALAALVTPEEIGEVIVRHVLEVLGAPVGLFYLTDAAGDLRLAHARGYPMGLAGHDARLGRDDRLPAVDALRDARPIVVPDPENWRRRYPGASDRLGMTGTRSVVAWPIGTPASAVLVVQRAQEGAPTDDQMAQLEVAGHQAMQAIERARVYAKEREARQLQEAFVGVMSHELRTPITTILAGSKLLARDRSMGDRSRELANDIEAEADRLFRLVEDLLVLSRLERGSLSVGDEPVHLLRVIQRVVSSEAGRWPGTRFVLPSERRGHLVRGDETYVEQVLRNLLTNAAKYSPVGSVVEIGIEPHEDDVAIRVLDQGGGVTDEEVEQLFGLFYRSPTTAASAAGAGIGLFVCRRLVGAMGGRIWARARPEGGSEFGFALASYPDDDADVPEAGPQTDRRVSGDDRPAAASTPVGTAATRHRDA